MTPFAVSAANHKLRYRGATAAGDTASTPLMARMPSVLSLAWCSQRDGGEPDQLFFLMAGGKPDDVTVVVSVVTEAPGGVPAAAPKSKL